MHPAIVLVHSSFENVPIHLLLKRGLSPKARKYRHRSPLRASLTEPMNLADMWLHWAAKDEPELGAFAAITDERPAEISETKHSRCIISLQPQNVDPWLKPDVLRKQRLAEISSARHVAIFEHRIAG